MTEQIVKDLIKNFDKKMQNATRDYVDLCGAADVSPNDMAAHLGSSLLNAAIRFVAATTKLSPKEFGEVMERKVTEARAEVEKLIEQKEEKESA